MRGEWAKVHLKGKKKLRAAVDTELKENIEIGIETVFKKFEVRDMTTGILQCVTKFSSQKIESIKVSFYNLFCLPGPAKGVFRSSQRVTPSQAHILLEFSKRPEDLAIIPQLSSLPQLPLILDKE